AWKSLTQSKVALRHIENRIQAAPGTGVILDSVIDSNKKKSSRAHHRGGLLSMIDGRQVDDIRGSSKPRGRSQQSPEKSSSRSPLRNTTQDRNVRRNNSVEFREPLASYSQKLVPASLYPSSPPRSDSLPSQLVYQKHTIDKEADKDLDSTRSSGRESTEVRYLNDQPALDSIRTKESSPKAQVGMDSQQSSPCIASTPGSFGQEDSTPSTSPGSASQRLENLRRHQPDNKLEKLKERIRRQRQHLEEAAEREKLMGNLEQPLATFVETNDAGTSNKPAAKIRKVAAAPPAPIYKGFNSTETKIRTPDGKVWKEEDFHNLSRELYRDLSKQFAGKHKTLFMSKERRPPKTIRKVHRAAPASDLNPKPAISPASWREGQKLVKMVLGPVPQLPREEDSPHAADLLSRTGENSKLLPNNSRHRSDLRSESKRRSRPNSTERPCSGFQGQSQSHLTPTSIPQDKVPGGLSSDLLSADIQGILDDLQLECKAAEQDERARKSSSRVCRSASPTTHRPETTNITDAKHKKRHYDADTVRQYIARQQEERKRRQADEKKAMREESERRHQRLQELYRKQREVARTVAIPTETPVAPVQKRLQETYNKLLMEEAQLGEGAMQTLPRPMYQPSGESDKENKRLEAPQSPSSSDRSLNDHPPPPLTRPLTGPSSTAQGSDDDRLFSQLLRIEAEVAASNGMKTLRPATAPSSRSRSKMSRIEAIKATAASLSNRIESEARKLAGEGINYGNATSMDMDTVLVPRPSVLVDGWAGTAARDTEKDNMALRIQKILTTTNYSSYNGTALPGAGSLHSFREQKVKNGKQTSVDVIDPIFNSYTQERGKLVNGLEKESRMNKISERKQNMDEGENRTDLHDSSGGSISEGPLLSEGSFSEDEQSPPHPSRYNYVPRPADRLEAADYCARQRKDYQRLMEFQREAEKCSGLSLSFAQQDRDKAVWEELNKGSPLSVINIFTKNHHSHVKGEFTCEYAYNSLTKLCLFAGTVSDQSDTTLVEEQRSSCSPASEALSSESRKGGSDKNSSHTQAKSVHSNDTLGEASGHSHQHSFAYLFYLFLFMSNSLRLCFLPGELQYSPGVLQQRMAAELHYLDSIEESFRQLGDVERLMGVSMAQQESASLAQMLKAKQQRHERELYELKIKAEREALETKLQLEENRQRVARVLHTISSQEPTKCLQESTTKMMTQQAEAAQYTADAARHIKEVSNQFPPPCLEKACVLIVHQHSPSHHLSNHEKQMKKEAVEGKWRNSGLEKRPKREAASSSIEEEVLAAAANDSVCSDSIPSVLDEKDSTSVATEYSLKFDESMTEDEIEERSFRSLLPSEAHRRGTMEKKSRHHEESEDDGANHSTLDSNIAFSGGQDSFSQFTMDMVRQYMKDEEVRLQHQSSLLRLRQKALKEKTRTELAWLEHLKKKLRDKGEDDKMPPIRKKQRGLLLKLQQEQAEIRRLQEANKAARKERQLLLKQQEEIERMRNSTLRLKERLKCAGIEPASPDMRHADDNRSPSPSLSVSGSETSSIMQKLKKMRSHMDEKFLTKREQQLMQRRHHAEELLQWKQQLDKEEAEVRRMEKEALAAWDQKTLRDNHLDVSEGQEKDISDISSHLSHRRSSEPRTDSEKGEIITLLECEILPDIVICHVHFSLETISDQSDIESRIKALKEELKKRKLMASELKKEQKKRHKERLKAEEASLLKQLENYNNFIEKTKADLNKEPDLTLDTNSQINESNSEASIKDTEASPVADGYHDDFESSVDSSSKEEHHSSKAESQTSHVSSHEIKGSRKDASSRGLAFDSPDEVVEEEIAEDLSHHSGISVPSHKSGRLLDLNKQAVDFKRDNESFNSRHSPTIYSLQVPLSPVIDEMPDFYIGDRVLVGGVQPGTLRFKGPTSFANGFWAGVELDKSEGSNNGTYDGVVYFECDERHGIFAPPDKITHLPDKFELYTDTTEDEDSFFDDLSDKDRNEPKTKEDNFQMQENLNRENEQTSHKETGSNDKKETDGSVLKSQDPHWDRPQLNSQHHKESKHQFSDENIKDLMLNSEDASHTLIISDLDKTGQVMESKKEITALVEKEDVESHDDKRKEKDKDFLDTVADRLVNNFVEDALKQCAEIKRAKEQKIEAAKQMNGDLFGENEEEEEEKWKATVDQKDDLPFFLPVEKEELSSPELCNRPESPVLGAIGQEELAKRLAELELSRELLDDLGDDQDWFDEDFGLSSRRKQQKLKEEEARLGAGFGRSKPQVKTPPRPELPLPLPPKLPEQPVEKMVHAATRELWDSFDLGNKGTLTHGQLLSPQPSLEYLGKEDSTQNQESLSIRSYRKAVYDLTWEILQEIYAEDPNTNQPQWVKPRRVKSSSFHKVRTPGDIKKIQEFITEEVLKLYGLTKDQNQKNDWQKMLKFGRKKRDRVDHILVQELHEEEAQWVNYDEDELFVKMQLADSIFDSLLKDTVNVLTLISDKRANRDTLS
uniref:Centrosomal protein 350 n=1 Tax=Haplochromis burtoni TaxID=8153 RepID=A0A3Q2XF97_HAPBU